MVATIRNSIVLEVKPPLQGDDPTLLMTFRIPKWGTVIYVPYDPTTGQIPAEKLNGYPERDYSGVKVRYSPNLWEIFMKYYVQTDSQGRKYFVKFPVLLVDYNTITHLLYAGKLEPQPRPIEQQLADWKSGVMWGRYPLKSPVTETYCPRKSERFGCIGVEQVTLPAGWYWVGYEARLLEIPSSILKVQEDVIVFAYRRPKNIAFKIPGFRSIAEYVYKEKIERQYDKLEALLQAFGFELDGKPWVKETSDGYNVYMPVRRVAGLALPVIPLWLIGLIIVSITLIVSFYYISSIESEKAKNFRYYLNFVSKAQDEMTQCIQNCKGNPKCIETCKEAYNSTVNAATDAFKSSGAGFGKTIGEMTELIKWGIVAMVVINLMSAFKR